MEHLTGSQKVAGSIPVSSTNSTPYYPDFVLSTIKPN
jgi:hypothetical protein